VKTARQKRRRPVFLTRGSPVHNTHTHCKRRVISWLKKSQGRRNERLSADVSIFLTFSFSFILLKEKLKKIDTP
jgi:hypothetical protein